MAFKLDNENNPLFQEKPNKKKRGKPQSPDVVHGNSVQEGLHADYTRATLIIKVETLQKLKDYAYTTRLSMKDASEKLLSEALDREEEKLEKQGKKLLRKE